MESRETIGNKYIILEEKGQGLTSNVFLVKDLLTEKIYAAKVLKKPLIYFDKEIEILNSLKKINNPYIVNLIESGTMEIIKDNKSLQKKQYLILEYAKKGELFKYIFNIKKGLQEKYSKLIFYKILKGIQACHEAGICHRDLKMENILMDENFNPKICDFGFATFNTGNLNDFLGTKNYAAPEIFLNKPYDGYKADIFSLGVLLLALVKCKFAFQEATQRDSIYRLIMIKHYKLYWKKVGMEIDGISEELKNLYIKMVSFRPKDRPTIKEILNDDWMKEIRDLNKKQLDELENEIRIEFLEREQLIQEELKHKKDTKK